MGKKRKLPKERVKQELHELSIKANQKEVKILGLVSEKLAYTKYEIDQVKSEGIKSRLKSVEKEISEDINFFELRVNQNKLRVHGFQSQSAFFLVVLDRNHEVFPM